MLPKSFELHLTEPKPVFLNNPGQEMLLATATQKHLSVKSDIRTAHTPKPALKSMVHTDFDNLGIKASRSKHILSLKTYIPSELNKLIQHSSLQLKMYDRVKLIIHHIKLYELKLSTLKHNFNTIFLFSKLNVISFYHQAILDFGRFIQSLWCQSHVLDFTEDIYSGGGPAYPKIEAETLYPFIKYPKCPQVNPNTQYEFKLIIQDHVIDKILAEDSSSLICDMPLAELAPYAIVSDIKELAKLHGIKLNSRLSHADIITRISDHFCTAYCNSYFYVFRLSKNKKEVEQNKWKIIKQKQRQKNNIINHPQNKQNEEKRQEVIVRIRDKKRRQSKQFIQPDLNQEAEFPPQPASTDLIEKIIRNYCQDTSPEMFEEAGCGVCGQLSLLKSMVDLADVEHDLSILKEENISRIPCKSANEEIKQISEPIIDSQCTRICEQCNVQLSIGKRPANALANGLWLGEIPEELQELTFAEQVLISRIRHNRCLVHVSSGRAKMVANCIMFPNPIAKIYHALPPSREDINEVLACVFLGSAQPTEKDYE